MTFARSLAMLASDDVRPQGGVLPAASTHVTDTLACIVGAHADPLFRVFRARAAALTECDVGAVSEALRLALEGGPAAAAQWLALAAHWLQYDNGERLLQAISRAYRSRRIALVLDTTIKRKEAT